MAKKKTHEEFIHDIELINKNIEILETYKNSRTKIKCKCKIDGHIWDIRPCNLLNGEGCPICAIKNRNKKPKKNTETFIKELHEKNNNIELLDEYVSYDTQIRFQCKIDGFIFKKTPTNMLLNPNCPKCTKKIKMSNLEFVEKLFNTNKNIKPLEEFTGVDNHILCECKIDGYRWSTTPWNLLHNKSGCPKCSNVPKKDTKYFKNELSKINQNIEIIGEYVSAKIPILCNCKIHNYKWETTPDVLLRGSGCPICNQPHGERKITQYLLSNNILFVAQKEFNDLKGINNGKLSYDFYLQNYNILIEFQGEQHYKPINHFGGENKLKIQQEHDRRKRQYAKDHGIKLLEIAYWDFDNIEEILSRELGLTD